MKKHILTFVLVLLSSSVFSEDAVIVEEAIHPVLVTTLIELPTKCKISEFSGYANIGVRDKGEGYNPVKVGDIVDQTSIIFMARNSKVVLLGEGNTKVDLKTKESGETFTFNVRK